MTSLVKACKTADHMAMSLQIVDESRNDRCGGYWKINNSILSNSSYEDNVNNVIQGTITECMVLKLNKRQLWDTCNIKIKETTITFCKNRSKNQKDELDEASVTKLEDVYEKQAVAAQVRARARWIEDGEKPTKNFLNLEKSRQSKNVIRRLKTEEGNTIIDKDTIFQYERHFYETLYSSSN